MSTDIPNSKVSAVLESKTEEDDATTVVKDEQEPESATASSTTANEEIDELEAALEQLVVKDESPKKKVVEKGPPPPVFYIRVVKFPKPGHFTFRLLSMPLSGATVYHVDKTRMTKKALQVGEEVVFNENLGDWYQGIAIDGGSANTSVYLTGPTFQFQHASFEGYYHLNPDNTVIELDRPHPEYYHWNNLNLIT